MVEKHKTNFYFQRGGTKKPAVCFFLLPEETKSEGLKKRTRKGDRLKKEGAKCFEKYNWGALG